MDKAKRLGLIKPHEKLMNENKQQAQTIKELQSKLEAKTGECEALQARVSELRDWVEGVRIRYQNIPPENGVEQMEFDAAMETLKRVPAQSLSAIRNEAIREGWDMCKNAGIKQLECWTHSTGKMALRSFRNLPYPQLTEEE